MRCTECRGPAIAHDESEVYLCAENPEHEGVEDSPWRITDDALANWALARLALAEHNIDRIDAAADDQIRRAEEYRQNAARRFRNDAEFFRSHLIGYYRQVAPTLGKAKTYELPNGSVTSRQGSEVVVIEDPDDFCETALSQGLDNLVRTKHVPDKAAVKAYLNANQTEIPGVRLERKPDEVTVKPAKGEIPAFLPVPVEDEAAV